MVVNKVFFMGFIFEISIFENVTLDKSQIFSQWSELEPS